MNKIVMTFEAYQTYSDYEKGGKSITSPKDMLQGVTISVKHLTPSFDDKWIESIEDQSDEKKGIKFEIKLINGDVIHAFKVGRVFNQWEWYLNKKKKSDREIKSYLSNALLTPYERWESNFNSFDKTYMYSDDSRAYKSGAAHEKEIIALYANLSNSDKKTAYKKYTETIGKENPISFSEFKGI